LDVAVIVNILLRKGNNLYSRIPASAVTDARLRCAIRLSMDLIRSMTWSHGKLLVDI
jgi:hypothetical protein